MRFDRQPLYSVLQDKFLVREYAEERGVSMASLLYVTNDPATIPFGQLPSTYMIKATHGCGWNIVCRDGRLVLFGDGSAPTGDALSQDEAVALCRGWLQGVHAPREWAYRGISPRIVVEQLLAPRTGDELMDYRFYTFDGVVKAINLGSPTYRREQVNAFYTPEWQLVPLSRYTEALPAPLPKRPTALAKMIAVAGRLGNGIPFVRVDLYDTAEGVRLGEMTVYPQAGARDSPTGCRAFNSWLGQQWRTTPLQHFTVLVWNAMHLLPDAFRSIRSHWLEAEGAS
jgi:hypothetical protein